MCQRVALSTTGCDPTLPYHQESDQYLECVLSILLTKHIFIHFRNLLNDTCINLNKYLIKKFTQTFQSIILQHLHSYFTKYLEDKMKPDSILQVKNRIRRTLILQHFMSFTLTWSTNRRAVIYKRMLSVISK